MHAVKRKRKMGTASIDPSGRINIAIPVPDREMLDWLNQQAQEQDRSVGRQVLRILRQAMEKEKANGKV